MTGITASVALLVEPRLQVPSDIHFFLQFLWIGIVGTALLAFSFKPVLKPALASDAPMPHLDTQPPAAVTAELLDEDRLWLQNHPDSSWNEQV